MPKSPRDYTISDIKTQPSQSTYLEKLLDPRWQKIRLKVLERDDWHCQCCFDGTSTLHVHHKYYKKENEPWDYPLEALITLCAGCHEYETRERAESERILIQVLKRRYLFTENIYSLAEAFLNCPINLTFPVRSNMLVWLLGQPDILEELTNLYREECDKPLKRSSEI